MTLYDRVSKILTPEDAEEQIRRAKAYQRRLELAAKKAEMFTDKIDLGQQAKQAEGVVRQLRRLIFDIEDALAEGKPASSVI